MTAICPGYTITGFQRNALSEMEMPQPSRLARGVSAEAAEVMIKNLSPRLMDWGLRRLWLSSRSPIKLKEQ